MPAIIETSGQYVSSSLFQVKSNRPTSSQTQLPTNILREVNQAVTAALGREEERSQRAGTKQKYTKLFTPISSFSLKKGVHVCLYI